MCEESDFSHATVGAEFSLPHLVTEAVPFFERELPRLRDMMRCDKSS